MNSLPILAAILMLLLLGTCAAGTPTKAVEPARKEAIGKPVEAGKATPCSPFILRRREDEVPGEAEGK